MLGEDVYIMLGIVEEDAANNVLSLLHQERIGV